MTCISHHGKLRQVGNSSPWTRRGHGLVEFLESASALGDGFKDVFNVNHIF
jgi:hypothetical protein